MTWAFLIIVASLVPILRPWWRWWTELEDARAMALLRIFFGLCVLVSVIELLPYAQFLFGGEGLLSAELRSRRYGFQWYALPYWSDSPIALAVQIHGFLLVTILWILGWRTRVTGLLSFLAYLGIANSNDLYWHSNETLIKCLYIPLVLADAGAAYGVDARRVGGRLVMIPSWPRKLVMMQVVVIYVASGFEKVGTDWQQGSTLYYLLNRVHFARFESLPDVSFVHFILQWATWLGPWFERLFWLPLVWMHACVVRAAVPGWRFALAGGALALGVGMKAADVTRCGLPLLPSSASFGLLCALVVVLLFAAAWLRLPGFGRVLAWSTWRTLAVLFQLFLFVLFDFGVLQLLMIVAGSALADSMLDPGRDPMPAHPTIGNVGVVAVVSFHVMCLWTWALPSGIGCGTPERSIAVSVASGWLRELQVRQRWRMFAGGGGHANELVITRIYDRDGTLIGGGGEMIDALRAGRGGRRSDGRWFAPYLARYECRRRPDAYTVAVVRVTQPIPTPQEAWRQGVLVWPSLVGPTQERVLHEGNCDEQIADYER